MTPSTSMRDALADPNLLGATIAGDSWRAWRVLLIAAMGEELTDDERTIFTQLTGRAREPLQPVEEFCAIVGRRGGKTRSMATLAVYLAALVDHRDKLVRGEVGVCLCISPDQRQSSITLNYVEAAFEASPILRQLIANRTADTIELTNGINVEVRAASFRRLRGPTYIAAVADESAFWLAENSANPDVEIINAVKPGLATTGGPLILASSPYARKGVIWEAYRRHYGPDGDPLILVAQGSSRTFNPSLPQRVVDRALERDRASAEAEFLGFFRSDIESYISLEVVSACVGDHVEMAALSTQSYVAFTDPSGGSHDGFTMAVAHADGERAVIDMVAEITPPFSPDAVIEEFATRCKAYRITRVEGDRYGGEFPRELFRKHGVEYEVALKPKSDLYRDLLPLLNAGRIVLPRSERLVAQFVGLERRTARSGRDSIDHGVGGHDDLCNAVAGAAALAIDTTGYDRSLQWITGPDRDAVAVDVPARPKRLHPNLTDEAFLRIRAPVALTPRETRENENANAVIVI
jgi:hypothetical protein